MLYNHQWCAKELRKYYVFSGGAKAKQQDVVSFVSGSKHRGDNEVK